MENLLGKIEACLAEKEIEVSDDLVFLINTRIKPPLPVKKEDIYIRAMYLVSDQVNSFGGCFPLDEHPKLAELLVDTPVLVGHSKERLPIARNFKADLVKKDGVNWIKVYFYWLKTSPDADSLKENIDHGIYKECSIGFSFEFPECSICREDMRKCQHIPFRTYQKEKGDKEQAYFKYRHIIKVHETSLVYRGAVFGTSMTNELALFQKHDCADGVCKFKRVYKESIEESLKKAGLEGKVNLAGKMADDGYSENEIDLVCDNDLEEKVLNSLPEVLRQRVCFVRGIDKNEEDFHPTNFILRSFSRGSNKYHQLEFLNGTKLSELLIRRLNLERLSPGRKFLADWSFEPGEEDFSEENSSASELDAGGCCLIEGSEDFYSIKMDGQVLIGVYLVRKIKIKNEEKWLFQKMV